LGTKALRSPIHSLEINCVKKFEFGSRTFLVTGSEDTKIKIFDVFGGGSCVATLNTHISSVKCLDVVTVSDVVYIVSAGSRAQVRNMFFNYSTSYFIEADFEL
jgi:WD40 repeat protein